MKQSQSVAKVALSIEGQKNNVKVLIIHTKQGFSVFENRCTHSGMSMKYLRDEDQLRCISFGNSRFDMNGNVVKGPAARQLKSYQFSLNNERLKIRLDG